MQGWQTTFLGMRELPRDISGFEMKAFFTFDGAEREAINARRGDAHKLCLALHIVFLRMSGRLLYGIVSENGKNRTLREATVLNSQQSKTAPVR